MRTIIQRVSDYAESIHQADEYDEGWHDAPTLETCTAPICKGFADALALTTDAIYHAPTPETPTLSEYGSDIVALAAGTITKAEFAARRAK